MICVSLIEPDHTLLLKKMKRFDFVEIRIEALEDKSESAIEKIFSSHKKLIATFRSNSHHCPEKAGILKNAIISGAAYVDIEIEENSTFKKKIIGFARHHHCKVIISYHNYSETPDITTLKTIADQCFEEHADIAKIACHANTENDTSALLGLLSYKKNILSIAMGEKGKISRIASVFAGAPFTFSCPSETSSTAPGQIHYKKLADILNTIRKA